MKYKEAEGVKLPRSYVLPPVCHEASLGPSRHRRPSRMLRNRSPARRVEGREGSESGLCSYDLKIVHCSSCSAYLGPSLVENDLDIENFAILLRQKKRDEKMSKMEGSSTASDHKVSSLFKHGEELAVSQMGVRSSQYVFHMCATFMRARADLTKRRPLVYTIKWHTDKRAREFHATQTDHSLENKVWKHRWARTVQSDLSR